MRAVGPIHYQRQQIVIDSVRLLTRQTACLYPNLPQVQLCGATACANVRAVLACFEAEKAEDLEEAEQVMSLAMEKIAILAETVTLAGTVLTCDLGYSVVSVEAWQTCTLSYLFTVFTAEVSFFSQSDAENVESLLKTEVSTLILFVVGKLYNWDIPA
ncbi:unnamed protein product [Effrenium voratum]|nr:unnamed protein product [Effrenium voratum]